MKRKITFVLAIMMLLTILTSCGKDNNANTEQHVHAYGDWNIVTEATCTEKGLEERVCSCGEKETREINVTEHDYTKLDTGNTHIKTNATCLKQAEYYYSCSKCGANGSETFSFGSIASHKWDNGTESSGIIEYHCQNCTETKNVFNKKTEVQATVSKTDLQSVGGIELKNATIIFDDDTLNGLDDNVEISADIVSGEELNEVKSNLTPEQQAVIGSAQIFDFSIGDEPTTFDGKVTVTIPYVLGENEDPEDVVVWYLNGSDVEVISATYASGFVSFETNHFSLYVPVVMSAEDRCAQGLHDFTETKVDSTCTKQGSIKKVCIHCEEQELQVLELLPHTYNQTIVSEIYLKSPATDTQNAIYYKSCICGATGTETFEYKAMSKGLDFKLSDDRTYYFLTGIGTCTDTDIVIPFIYNNVPVTRIYPEAFHNCSGLTSIEIPDSVTSIGYRAFSGCSGLTSIGIPDSVTSIDYGTFEDCSGLTSIEIPDSVTSIGDGAFEGCSGLTSITIPFVGATKDGTINTHLGYIFGAYSYSSNSSYVPSSLKSVTITGGTSIGSSAFHNCSGLTSVAFGENSQLTSIGEDAFWKCNGLTSIVIPDSVTSIGSSAFYECSGLNEVHISDIAKWCGISFGDDDANPLYYAHNLYLNDTLITDLVIPDSVTSIGSYVFEGCSGLTSIEIPDSVTSIGGFEGCSGLTSIVIPDSVTSIGYGAFCGCSGLSSITIPFVGEAKDGTSYTHFGYFFGASRYENNSKYVPSSLKSVTITGGTSIGKGAFEDCSGLTSIVIPDSVTSIGEAAFYNCSGLTSITIPFVGATKDGTSNTYFGYFFGASRYADNSKYVPSSLKSVTITGGTSIGDYAFYNCSGLTSVTIGNSVTSIGSYAFYNCSGLTSIIIPDSVTSIGEGAFEDCSGLTSIEIPDSITSIGKGAFEDCSGLTSIVIPDSVTSIGGSAFYNCSGLTSVAIGNSVTSIGGSAFYNCSGLTSVAIGNGVTSIGSYAFRYCSGLTSIIIPDSVTSISSSAFKDCSGLTSIVIPDSVTSISSSAFKDCSGLTSITIPFVGATKDGTSNTDFGYIFGGSVPSSLKSVTITGGTSIGSYAFYNCSRLTSIVIPDSVTSIGSSAFENCSGLNEVHISDIAKWCSISFGDDDANPLYYAYNLYLNDTLITDLVIPDGVTSIGKYAFYKCSGLTSIVIPDSVTSIGDKTFVGCSGLTSITIPFVGATKDGTSDTHLGYIFGTSNPSFNSNYVPSSLKSVTITGGTSIGSDAFRGCSGLTSIIIPDSVTSIGDSAFSSCSGLTSIVIPDIVTSIGSYAFWGCSGLTSIEIPDSVTSIGGKAFSGCSGLTSIVIPDSVTSIGDSAFSSCSGLTSITIPFVGATKDGTGNTHFDYIFDDSVPSSLKSVTITGGTSIGEGAFSGCSGLTSIIIPDSVTSIGDSAFSSCSGLTSIVIPDIVTSIGEAAFYNCSGLTSIVIPDIVTSIGKYAFSDCSGLTSIVIPDSVTSIGSSAFENCSGLKEVHISDIAKWCGISFGSYDANPLYYTHNLYLNDTLITDLVIPDGVTSIGDYAFYYCRGLRSVTIGNGVTSIGSLAFYGCSGLTSVTIGNSVTSIGDSAFDICNKLVEVFNKSSLPITKEGYNYGQVGFYAKEVYTSDYVSKLSTDKDGYIIYTDGTDKILIGYTGQEKDLFLPTGITEINQYAFYNCEDITSVVIPNSVTSIGGSAFFACTGLTSIEIPNSVTSINVGAFYNCSGLTSVTIGNGVTSIGSYAFENCRGLASIVIPDSVTSIGRYAFDECSGLTSVTIGNSVTSIGDYAFVGCYKLVEVFNKSSLSITKGSQYDEYVGYYAKEVYTSDYVSKLSTDKDGYIIYTDGTDKILMGYTGQEKDLTLPTDITEIYQYAFYKRTDITSIVIPDSVTSIGKYAFKGCSGLTSVTIGNSVTSIGSYAFSGCSGLTSIVIPDSVTSIGDRAFYECSGLTSIVIPDSVTSIGDRAFYNCSGLTSVTIGNGVTSIGSYAFYYCRGLTSVTIGNSVTSIGKGVFCDCSRLRSIVIPDSVTSIGGSAFSGCSGLKKVYYNGTASEWTEISINSANSDLTYATRYYYSASQPIEEGNWWHYDTDGVTVLEW